MAWIAKRMEVDKKDRFALESLYAAILNDILDALNEKSELGIIQSPTTWLEWSNKILFGILAVAGIIFFGSEGFGGVYDIAKDFNMPNLPVFIVAVPFLLLSCIVFCAFDLVEISENLGVDLKSSTKMIDVYLSQLNAIKALRTKINNNFVNKSLSEIEEYIALLKSLQQRFKLLQENGEALQKALNNPVLKGAKLVVAAVAGILFFSGGYFAGQTLAMAFLLFFMASVSSTFWPVIVISVIVGLASLSIYWFVERPGIENLVGRFFGRDKNKIQEFCDEEANADEAEALDNLLAILEAKQIDLLALGDQENRIAEQVDVISDQSDLIKAQATKIEALEKRLAKLEAKENTQSEVSSRNSYTGRFFSLTPTVDGELRDNQPCQQRSGTPSAAMN